MAVENLEGFGKPRTDRQKSSKTAVGCETGSGRKTVILGIHSKLPHVPVESTVRGKRAIEQKTTEPNRS